MHFLNFARVGADFILLGSSFQSLGPWNFNVICLPLVLQNCMWRSFLFLVL